MKVAEKATPLAAVVAALSTLACCMPLGLLGAAGLTGFALWAGRYRLLFLVLAFAFLIAGSVQLYAGRKTCRARSKTSVITFWVAVAIVIFIFLFPQVVAGLLAGWS